MKPRTLNYVIASILFTTLALPVQLTAQHIRFKLIDIGAPFGGPNSSPPPPNPDAGPVRPDFGLYPVRSLNSRGMFAGQAETSTKDHFDFCFNAFGDCLVSQALQWQHGMITNLGALTDGVSSAPAWISDSGLIAGVSENGEIDPLISGFPELHAVLWKHGEITDLGTLEGAHESLATAVNSRGQVVGVAVNTIPDSNSMLGLYETRAFLWEHGVMQDLGTLGGTDAMALLVSEGGQVVGQSYTADSAPATTPYCAFFPLTQHGFLWENGKMVDIGTLGGSCTFTYGLNNKGQVVGQSTTPGDPTAHPFVWDRGTITDLGTLGGNYGWANWINDAGEIAGTASPDGKALIAFSWKNGVQTGLGTLNGDPCSVADAVNSKAQVVGGSGSFGTGGFFPACETPSGEQAVLWENGRIVDLNAFVPPDSDLTLVEATSINDRGEISGFGTLNDDVHAFLLIPCSEGTEDCRDESASATRTRQGHSTAQRLAILRMMPGSHARFAQRYRFPGLQAAKD